MLTIPLLYQAKPQISQSGLLGYWCADTLQNTGSRAAIPNQASGRPLSLNLLGPPRRLFANAQYFAGGGSVLTDDAAADSDGATEASTLVGTGGWYWGQNAGQVVPAGTYTMAVSAKRNTGTDQFFAMSKDFTGSRSAQKTAGPTWQRYTYTFTLASPGHMYDMMLCSWDGATSSNIQIADWELFPGSSDLGGLSNTLGGHLYLGLNFADTLTASGGFVDFTGKLGIIQFPTPNSVTAFTGMAVVKKTSNGNTVDCIFSRIQNYADFALNYNENGQPQYYTKASGQQQFGQFSGLWQPNGLGAHVVAWRVTATEESLWIDGVKLISAAASAAAASLRDLWVGRRDTFYGGTLINQQALWNRALSDAEMESNRVAMVARAQASNISVSPAHVYIALGDSITGAFTYAYPYGAGPSLSPGVFGVDLGVAGYILSDVVTNKLPLVVSMLKQKPAGMKVTTSLLIGANDLGTYPGASDAAAAAAYTAAIKANVVDVVRGYGAKHVQLTILPIDLGTAIAAHNARRAICNPTITGWVASKIIDGCTDIAANATYGPDAAAANVSLYPDNIHPSATGQGQFATAHVTTLNALI